MSFASGVHTVIGCLDSVDAMDAWDNSYEDQR